MHHVAVHSPTPRRHHGRSLFSVLSFFLFFIWFTEVKRAARSRNSEDCKRYFTLFSQYAFPLAHLLYVMTLGHAGDQTAHEHGNSVVIVHKPTGSLYINCIKRDRLSSGITYSESVRDHRGRLVHSEPTCKFSLAPFIF